MRMPRLSPSISRLQEICTQPSPGTCARVLVEIPRHCRSADELAAGTAGRRPAARDDPDRMSMRIAPRTLFSGTAWRLGGTGAADTHFDELRDLCTAAGDQRSLAIGMAGLVIAHSMNLIVGRLRVSPMNSSTARLHRRSDAYGRAVDFDDVGQARVARNGHRITYCAASDRPC